MTEILIIENDEFARKTLGGVLAQTGRGRHCRIVPLPEDSGDAAVRLYIRTADAPPSAPALGVKESDQFEKPLRLGAFLDRLDRHIAALTAPQALDIMDVGPYRLDCRHNFLTAPESERTIRLTDKETGILRCLAQEPGAVVQRQRLLDEVWGYGENIETHTLETHIYRLRQKIEDDPGTPALLVTVEQGYRLDV